MLEYVTDFNDAIEFIDHMSQVLLLSDEDKKAFADGMDKFTLLAYLQGLATYAYFETLVGADIMDECFSPLKVTEMKNLAGIFVEVAQKFI